MNRWDTLSRAVSLSHLSSPSTAQQSKAGHGAREALQPLQTQGWERRRYNITISTRARPRLRHDGETRILNEDEDADDWILGLISIGLA